MGRLPPRKRLVGTLLLDCWVAAHGHSFHFAGCELLAVPHLDPSLRPALLQLSEYTASHFARSGIDLHLGNHVSRRFHGCNLRRPGQAAASGLPEWLLTPGLLLPLLLLHDRALENAAHLFAAAALDGDQQPSGGARPHAQEGECRAGGRGRGPGWGG